MEGTLWKWTNYFSGWQPRWFILDNGILSYYKSQDDVNSGCKGSVKMAVCDVNVHPTDTTRLDLIIPGEAHFYVRAATPQERQQWLVALGSCKACLTTVGRHSSDSVGYMVAPSVGLKLLKDDVMSPDILKVKKSELRLYCDLLMQQVHGVKTAVSGDAVPDVEKLNEATSLLSATCDTFIKTLEDCMTVTQAKIAYEVPHQHVTDSALPSTPIKPNSKSSMQRSNSADNKYSSSFSNKPGRSPEGNSAQKNHPSRSKSESSAPVLTNGQNSFDYMYEHYIRESASVDKDTASDYVYNSVDTEPQKGQQSSEGEDREAENMDNKLKSADQTHEAAASKSCNKYKTFFTTMPITFDQVELEADGGIPIKSYLDACRSILPIFDKLGSTTFSPVKMDIDGNIKKINQKYITNPEKFNTIQSIALHEVQAQQHHLSSSATTAILWLKRAVEFIRELLVELLSGKPDLSVCANNAYAKTLRPFHGWVVRGVFSVALRAIPYREEFLSHMAVSEGDYSQADFMDCLLNNIQEFVNGQDAVLKVMNDFLRKNELDSDEQV